MIIFCNIFYNILILLLFMVVNIFGGNEIYASQAIYSEMQNSHDEAKSYKDHLKLTNPDQIDNGNVIHQNPQVGHLLNLNDNQLMNQGANALNNSEEGKFLQKSEELKIDAMNEHDINNKNPLIINAKEIADDPFKHTEGSNFSTSESIIKTKILKSCREGVDFSVDITRQLYLEVELVEKWGNWQDREINIEGKVLYWDYNACGWSRKLREKYWLWYVNGSKGRESNLTPQQINDYIRSLIRERLGVELTQIGESVIFPMNGQGIGRITPLNSRWVQAWDYYVFKFKYREREKELKEKGEYWVVYPEDAEKLIEENQCREIERVCLEKGNKIYYEKYTVNRPCWKEQIKYQCTSEPKDGCNHLKQQHCQLDSSQCLKKIGDICIEWQKNYTCFEEKRELRSSLKDSNIFCLGGDCHTTTQEQNNDISNVGYLAVLNEMKKEMQTNPVLVFKGESNGCRKINLGNFLNCCSSMKGWGKDVRLGSCKAQEKSLALKRAKGQCHFVGTYCAERDPIFKSCIVKKSSYCCFNSKLARVFQEQGKSQLGIGFGSAESANCRGFTVEELQKIDFSKFDLEELFAGMIASTKSKIGKNFPKQINDQMPVMQQQKVNNTQSLTY